MQQRKIVVGHGVANTIKQEMGVSYPTIRTALAFASNTTKAKKIRQRAIQLGGVIMTASV